MSAAEIDLRSVPAPPSSSSVEPEPVAQPERELVQLSPIQVQSLLALINAASFQGTQAEDVAELKGTLSKIELQQFADGGDDD